jgi:hypothetical protein
MVASLAPRSRRCHRGRLRSDNAHGARPPWPGGFLGQCLGSSGACHGGNRPLPRPRQSSAHSWASSSGIRNAWTTVAPARAAIPSAAAGLHRPTSASAMCASRVQGHGGTVTKANQMLALRCAKDNGTCARIFNRYRQRIQDPSGSKLPKKQEMLPCRTHPPGAGRLPLQPLPTDHRQFRDC